MAIEKELLDRLLADYNCKKPEELIGENGLLKQLTKALLERALNPWNANAAGAYCPSGGSLIGNYGRYDCC